jgi:hypothetical protein
MRTSHLALTLSLAVFAVAAVLGGCDSDAKKACNVKCDAEAKRADKCDGPGAADCKAGIGQIVDECRTACDEQAAQQQTAETAEPAAE